MYERIRHDKFELRSSICFVLLACRYINIRANLPILSDLKVRPFFNFLHPFCFDVVLLGRDRHDQF